MNGPIDNFNVNEVLAAGGQPSWPPSAQTPTMSATSQAPQASSPAKSEQDEGEILPVFGEPLSPLAHPDSKGAPGFTAEVEAQRTAGDRFEPFPSRVHPMPDEFAKPI